MPLLLPVVAGEKDCITEAVRKDEPSAVHHHYHLLLGWKEMQ